MGKKHIRVGLIRTGLKSAGLKSAALAVTLALNSWTVGAAGLGRINVLSALGQPLSAEVDISASRDEVPTLSARLATADAFKQQGIAYGAALSGLRMVVDKRPSGQPFVRITGDRPVNEPFLELLVELSWGSGRLVREYTFLLDPPAEVTQKVVTAPVVPVEVRAEAKVEAKPEPVVEPKVAAESKVDSRKSAKVESKVEAKAAAIDTKKKEKVPVKEVKAATEKVSPGEGEHKVKPGETLGKIAAELKPEGVNLDQMLVALFRGNPEAFDGDNMNRLRAGKILKTPEQSEIEKLGAAEAKEVVVAQSTDFNAYRKKLAAAVAVTPAKVEVPKQAAVGKIAPKVEDKAPAAPAGKDKLEVSRTEAAKDAKGGKARIGAIEEDLVARNRALKEANSRISDLEKNLGDLKKLAELKSQSGAQMQGQAAKPAVPDVKKPEPPAPVKPIEPPKLTPPPLAPPTLTPPTLPPVAAKPAEPVKAVEPPKPAEPAKPAEPVKLVDTAKPADAAKPIDTLKPAEAIKPLPPKPAVKKAPPPPPPEPSFIEEYGAMLAMGGAGIVTALLGFLGFTALRKKRQAKAEAAAERPLTGNDLSANSVFGTTGGQSVDTAGAALPTDFGQIAGHDEGVDPVAEADVYMAYGRDAQAEEILIEALKKEPSRHTIHVKLLEIYSARRSAKQFETLAMDLKGQTGGSGPEWEKAATLGRGLEPANPLYALPGAEAAPPPVQAAQAPAAPPVAVAPTSVAASDASLAATVIFTPETAPEKMQSTVTMPGQLAHMAAAAEAQAPEEPESLDFDLDLGGPAAEPAAEAQAPAEPASMDFDLDLGGPSESSVPAAETQVAALDMDLGMGGAAEEASAGDLGIDFSLDIGGVVEAPEAPATPVTSAAAAPGPAEEEESAGGLDFDFGADEPAPTASAPAASLPADIADISLDLDLPDSPAAPAAVPSGAVEADNPEVTTKLELAQAYEEMGDKDGARELLQEVLAEGSAAQQETARTRLAKIG